MKGLYNVIYNREHSGLPDKLCESLNELRLLRKNSDCQQMCKT